MKGDFFYSESTGLYVARKPLRIDARVKDAAKKKDVKLEWDDEGRISFIDFDDSKDVLAALGAHMLTPIEYWSVYNDAKNLLDKDMIAELTSSEYAEWLNRVYPDDVFFIDNPTINGKYIYSGVKTISKKPFGTPGWFNPEGNINPVTGEPLKVELQREKFATSWKYWSPNFATVDILITAPIRGYVTSVGKPSFDLGIPVDVRQPKLMIRECRRTPLGTVIEESILSKAQSVLASGSPDELLGFLGLYGKLFSSVN